MTIACYQSFFTNYGIGRLLQLPLGVTSLALIVLFGTTKPSLRKRMRNLAGLSLLPLWVVGGASFLLALSAIRAAVAATNLSAEKISEFESLASCIASMDLAIPVVLSLAYCLILRWK